MKQHNELKAGLFIVISFGLAIVIFFGITGSSMFVGPTKMYAVDFDLSEDVGGLKSGSVVRIGGLNLGKVKRVEIIQGEGEAKTRAFFSLPVSYKLRQGAQIALQSGLIGSQVNLNITSLGTGSDLSDKDVIDGSPSPLALAIKGLGQASDEIVPMVRDIRNVTVPKVNTAIDKATTTFVTANETAGRFKITADEATELVKHIRSKVDPAFDKYHLVGDNAAATLHDTLNDPNAEPEQVQKLLDELQASFVDYKVVEEKLWDEVKE